MGLKKCNFGSKMQDMKTCPMIYIHWSGYYSSKADCLFALLNLCPNINTEEKRKILLQLENLKLGEVEMIKKTPGTPKGYIYCKECDIFYPEKYKREADAERKKNEKKEVALRRLADSMLRDCPFCAFKEATSFASAVMSFSSSRREHFKGLPAINRFTINRIKRCLIKATKK